MISVPHAMPRDSIHRTGRPMPTDCRMWFMLLAMALELADGAAAIAQQAGASSLSCKDATALLQTMAENDAAASHGRLQPSALATAAAMAEAKEAFYGRRNATGYRQAMLNFGDAQYVAYMTIGRQIITGILDTGSFELVVFGADCRTCGAAAHYSSQFSSSYQQGMLMTQQNFGSGGTVSMAGNEMVAIGPYPATPQGFWNVQQAQMSVLFSAAFEAIIGVGPPEAPMVDSWDLAGVAVSNVTSYYERGVEAPQQAVAEAQARIMVANEISKKVPMLQTFNVGSFSVCIGARPAADGVFVWDDPLPTARAELFVRVPITGRHSWTANLTNAYLDYPGGDAPDFKESSKQLGCEEGCSALLDSGTSLLAVPRPVLKLLELAMTLLKDDCSNLEVLPDIKFQLGGTHLTLPPDAYVAKVVGDAPRYLQELAPHINEGRRSRACQLMLMEAAASSSAGPVWILGVPFFRRYYTNFHLGGAQMDQRALFMSPHSEDECTPSGWSQQLPKAAKRLRYIAAERVRLPQMAQDTTRWAA